MFRSLLPVIALLVTAAGVLQGCSIQQVGAGRIVEVEGKTLDSWHPEGPPRISVERTRDSLHVQVERPESPVYHVEKARFEKVVTRKHLSTASVAARVLFFPLFLGLAGSDDVHPIFRLHALETAAGLAFVYDEREFVHPESRVIPDEYIVKHDVLVVAAREKQLRGIPGLRVLCEVSSPPGQAYLLEARTDARGGARFNLSGLDAWSEIRIRVPALDLSRRLGPGMQ